jgi:hypothetical protein
MSHPLRPGRAVFPSARSGPRLARRAREPRQACVPLRADGAHRDSPRLRRPRYLTCLDAAAAWSGGEPFDGLGRVESGGKRRFTPLRGWRIVGARSLARALEKVRGGRDSRIRPDASASVSASRRLRWTSGSSTGCVARHACLRPGDAGVCSGSARCPSLVPVQEPPRDAGRYSCRSRTGRAWPRCRHDRDMRKCGHGEHRGRSSLAPARVRGRLVARDGAAHGRAAPQLGVDLEPAVDRGQPVAEPA